MATFGRRKRPIEHLVPQGTVAGEDLLVGMLVKQGAGGAYFGTTAIGDHPDGVVGLQSANPDDGSGGLVPAGEDFQLVAAGYPTILVKDGQVVTYGDLWSPSDVKGKAQVAVAGSFVGGKSLEAVNGTDQKIIGSIGLMGYVKA